MVILKIVKNENSEEYRKCSNKRHYLNSSIPEEKVPIKNFEKPNRKDRYFKSCVECREYANKCKRNMKNRKLEEAKKLNKDPNFKFCISSNHKDVSNFPQDKVPIEMFFSKIGRKKILDNCSDCREHIYKVKSLYKEKLIEKSKNNDLGFCKKCYVVLEKENMRFNEDGEISNFCLFCSEKIPEINLKNKKRIKEIYYQILIEEIYKYESSCQRCKLIFLKPENDNIVKELNIYEKDGKNYVKYKEQEYLVLDFLDKYENLLEFRIIDFDHLTEEEQRERGILLPEEEYIPKINSVARMSNENSMRKEANKCQHLCCKCHVVVTNMRKFKDTKNNSSPEFLKRKEYVDKIKSEGCSVCGFYDPDPMLRGFMEMDHIDPSTKIKDVTKLIYGSLTFEDLVEECSKCRPICKFCHRLHSYNQRKNGIIN